MHVTLSALALLIDWQLLLRRRRFVWKNGGKDRVVSTLYIRVCVPSFLKSKLGVKLQGVIILWRRRVVAATKLAANLPGSRDSDQGRHL